MANPKSPLFLVATAAATVTLFFFAITACGQNGPGTTGGTNTNAGTGKVKVGVIMPFTGSTAYCGIQTRAGIEIARDELSELGSASPIELIYEDDQYNPRIAVTAYQKLVNQDGVKFIIGSCNSSATLALAPLAELDHTILITPASGSGKISQAGEYVFRTSISTASETKHMAAFISSKGWKRAAIYYLNNDYGLAFRDNLAKELKQYGGEIVLDESINIGDTDHKSRLLKLRGAGADVIVAAQIIETAATFYRQIVELKVGLPVVGPMPLERSNFVDTAGKDAVEGTFIISPSISAKPGFQEKVAAKMKSAAISGYKERFLPLETPGGYDAMLAINDAIKKCGTDTACAKDYLVSPGYFNDNGAMGQLRFDNYGDAIRHTIVKVFKNGDLIPYDDTPKTTTK